MTTNSVVLVLHGGKPDSFLRSRPWQVARIRMWPFVWSLRRHLPEADVIFVRYRYRGWNGEAASPVADVRQVLADAADRYGTLNIAVVGHSMGGRVAAAVADDPHVTTIVALAPWWQRTERTTIDEPNETGNIGLGQHVLVIHGSKDTWTSPTFSRQVVEQLTGRGVDAIYISIAGGGHSMLRQERRWVNLTAGFVRDHLDQRKRP